VCIYAQFAYTHQVLYRPLACAPQLFKMQFTVLCCDASCDASCASCYCLWSMHCTGGYSSNGDLLDAMLTGATYQEHLVVHCLHTTGDICTLTLVSTSCMCVMLAASHHRDAL
jgi:hypothetical protein